MPVPAVDPEAPWGPAKRVVANFAVSRAGFLYLRHISRHVDPFLHRISGGRVSTVIATPVVLLTTTGAKSGLSRTTALVYFTDADRVVLMASNYGAKRHPAWYHNLKANPEAELSARGYKGAYTATEATGAERERLWALAKGFVKNYGAYETTAGERQIPVMVLSPA
jgi:deazaflavin-dependent oxidoreductase (nitroreductase family)